MLADVLIPAVMFLTIFGVVYVFFTTRHRERLAMIEKGVSPKDFISKNRFGVRLGFLSIGIALGILLGQLVSHLTGMFLELAVFSMIFLFGGLGLVTEHYLSKKEN